MRRRERNTTNLNSIECALLARAGSGQEKGFLSRGIFYGIPIAVIIHSLDRSLSVPLIASYSESVEGATMGTLSRALSACLILPYSVG